MPIEVVIGTFGNEVSFMKPKVQAKPMVYFLVSGKKR